MNRFQKKRSSKIKEIVKRDLFGRITYKDAKRVLLSEERNKK